MKKFLIFISICTLFVCACIPTAPGGGISGTRIKAKLIRTTCASIVIQIQDSNYYYLGEQWSDISSPLTVMTEHAVAVSNTCEFPSGQISVGDLFYFDINSNPRNDCVVCAMYDAPPTKKVAIKNIIRI